MKVSLKTTCIMTAGAVGLLILLASAASADITDPTRPYEPYQPETSSYVPATPPPAEPSSGQDPEPNASPAPAAPVEEAEPVSPEVPAPAPEPAAVEREIVPSTPAPESVVTRAPRPVQRVRAEILAEEAGAVGLVDRITGAVQRTAHDVRASIIQAAGACKVAMGAGTGVPVLFLALLSPALLLMRERALGAWAVADEDVPELLYAGDVIAPG